MVIRGRHKPSFQCWLMSPNKDETWKRTAILTGRTFVASLASGSLRPYAGARKFVEMKSCRASDLGGLSFYAVVEDIAHVGLRMGEEAVPSRAQTRRFCWF